MNYNSFIEDELKGLGATLFGFASLEELDSRVRNNFKYGISIAIAVDPIIVSRIMSGPHIDYYNEIVAVNEKLKKISLYAEKLIKNKGFRAFSLANVKQDENFRTVLPYKTVATRAGIGWIGKSATLVNEEYGNALRLNAVLTDMPFLTGTPIDESKCGSCNSCVKNCPAEAIKGMNWNKNIERESLLMPKKCKAKVTERGLALDIPWGACGICIASCPYTKRYIEKRLII